MLLPEIVRSRVEKKVGEFCKRRVPAYALHQVNLSYKIRGNRDSCKCQKKRLCYGEPVEGSIPRASRVRQKNFHTPL